MGRHALISFAAPDQLDICLEVCQSVCLDNGAFSAWRSGKVIDWDSYFTWAAKFVNHPRVDFALIPDVIDGTEEENQVLLDRWSAWFGASANVFGVPVWHMHESAEKLKALCENYPRVAIGSSGDYSVVGSSKWHQRMNWAMRQICNEQGHPKAKIHMLRGLDPEVFRMYPFASADSTNAGRNCNIDQPWKGTYAPPSPSWC